MSNNILSNNNKTLTFIATSGFFLTAMSNPICDKSLNIANLKESVHSNIRIENFYKPVTVLPFNERLEKILYLSSNWDGYGAASIDRSVYSNTRAFLEKLDCQLLDCLEEEDILPTPYGTITLDFEREGNLVSVEIGKNQIGFFTDFLMKENMKSDGEVFIHNNIPQELRKALIDLLD